ncbi:MAG: hypothetical protein MUF54_05875 [Polyangiaceae bacterium]|nr:hypothetical protein [Polyangiaceae bacterium]
MQARSCRFLCAAAALGLASCHPEPGPSPYGKPIPGVEKRYSLGEFYDGYSVDTLVIDGVAAAYYIYVEQVSKQTTYSQAIDVDHVEGERATRITHAGFGWWAGGVHLLPEDQGHPFTAWKTLHISFKSSAPVKLMASGYGYSNDGQWHTLEVPLSDFEAAGVDMANINVPFSFGGGAGTGGESLLVDGLYLTP